MKCEVKVIYVSSSAQTARAGLGEAASPWGGGRACLTVNYFFPFGWTNFVGFQADWKLETPAWVETSPSILFISHKKLELGFKTGDNV